MASVWRSLASRGGALVQVRLTPEGFRQGNRGFGPMPYERNDRAELKPWRLAEAVEIVQLNTEWIRLLISSNRHFFKLDREHVSAELRCDPLQCSMIRNRIFEWRQATRRELTTPPPYVS